MQSHTCTASRSLSFRCDSVFPRSMPGAGPLPALICVGRYMPTSFRLVRPRTTSYWESPIPARPRDPSHSDVIQFFLETCQESDHSPLSSASGVTIIGEKLEEF
ncbi:hypothetical protein MTR_6g022660 [Medicago truncatula]|uniref:Uncharacterized protein n=1 Tax=Medicago truncatula TaxID=3880 RepID=A0A072U6Z1_MEDTR|nr:hypothetical protein MTR_6g022660 [Medicago truncatula]